MQLNHKIKLSMATIAILSSVNLSASNSDYVRINYMNYSESDNRVDVSAPAIEVSKDFGVDYTLKASLVSDTVSGATPVYTDTTSGASAFSSRGTVANPSNIKKTNVDFSEQRTALNTSLTQRLKNRDEINYGFNFSYESDYQAIGLNAGYLHWMDSSKNRSLNFGLSYANNTILNRHDSISGASKKETSSGVELEVGITQIIDIKSLVNISLFYSNESGYLTNPYYNVVRNTNEITVEARPDSRVSSGLNIGYTRAFSKDLTSKANYKYYSDDWGISSHTLDINNYYEINSKFTLGFGYRYYTQSAADFYNSSITYFTNEQYASHDDRLSSFNSSTIKTSLDYKYSKKLSYNVSFNKYSQSTGLDAIYSNIGVKYKF